ncbi:MAG: beta-propeller domain-containing protein [Burkholderiaceae bacterium]|nr:beta-propeller domain-containing protein [Burkholderiaceae bacterium]
MLIHRRQLLARGALFAAAAPYALHAGAFVDSAARTLTAYTSEAELRQALVRWHEQSRQHRSERRRDAAAADTLAMQAAPATAPAPMAAKSEAAGAVARAAEAESITNVQTAGVDEGGIVKRAGDFLIILRRGRLFTVRVGGDALAPVAAVDAYAPGSNPGGAWYDELLVSNRDVVVIGYSYARGGTEIGLFELGNDGSLAYRATHHLRSFDYYSSRNYASRLIGRKLVFYTPTLLSPWHAQPWELFPALRRWHGQSDAQGFKRILPATRVYRTDDEFEPGEALALHTITSCELGGDELKVESTAVLGPAGRVFYVSQGSVYVWASSWRRRWQSPTPRPQPTEPRSLSAVFRIPLDGTAPSAIKTAGVPIDQMSFLEDGGHLNVLLRESGRGEGMWGSEHTGGSMALLRVPLSAFGDGRGSAQPEHYRRLPAPPGHAVQNRFVGDWLLYGGAHHGRGFDAGPSAYALRFASGGDAMALAPGHAVERIEALGRDALLVGSRDGDLVFSAVRLGRRWAAPEPTEASSGGSDQGERGGRSTRRDPQLAGRHVQRGVAQGETRTHGFFYRPHDDDGGLLGLPVLGPGVRGRHGVYAGGSGAASVLFLRNRGLQFTGLGQLRAGDGGARDDACKASCVDWYGNARPIFLGERVLALMGYEIVEGRVQPAGWRFDEPNAAPAEQIVERRRISFAPNAAWKEGRYSPFN